MEKYVIFLCVCVTNFMEKYGTARQATNDNITLRMRIACWIPKVTYIQNTNYFPTASGYVNALRVTFIRKMRILFLLQTAQE